MDQRGIEPLISALQMRRSTTELLAQALFYLKNPSKYISETTTQARPKSLIKV